MTQNPRLVARTLAAAIFNTEGAAQNSAFEVLLPLVTDALDFERRSVRDMILASGDTARAAEIADKQFWLRCRTCGAIVHDYAVNGDCAYRGTWDLSSTARDIEALDGVYAANRYFEKHVCGQFEKLDDEKIGPVIARLIRGENVAS